MPTALTDRHPQEYVALFQLCLVQFDFVAVVALQPLTCARH
jgi:hypothetical protein